MQFNRLTINKTLFLLITGIALMMGACKKDEVYERTRLFRPVLTEDLMAVGNTIIVNMGNIREAVSYTVEVSRDTFATLDYTFDSDTNYVEINKNVLNGQSLLWNTLYQVRVTAHADDPTYDSRPSDLGSVRTERFPTILNIPGPDDVIDVAARVTWQVAGAAVTKIRTFTPDDLQLASPLAEFDVDATAQMNGEFIVTGLDPETAYQIAIYSGAAGDELRGWETYVTLEKDLDPNGPGVIDLTNDTDPAAVANAVAGAVGGEIIFVKKGVMYDLPSDPLDKAITIRGAYGFGAQKAILFTTGNWNFADGATVDYVRFINLELRGDDIGGDYVFNPNNSNETTINELTFDNCVINNVRGIIRIRSKVFLKKYNINNCIVHHIGGYGVLTTDTDGAGNAAVDDISFTNTTFTKIHAFLTSRQNAQSILIDACTLSELADPNGIVFRWRGEDGVLSNVLNGITITNTVWGHAWDEGMSDNLAVRGIYDGLEATNFSIVNTYATSDFAFTPGSEIPGFPALTYSGTAADLWVDPYDTGDFNFKDAGFAGRFDTGDPRWRTKL